MLLVLGAVLKVDKAEGAREGKAKGKTEGVKVGKSEGKAEGVVEGEGVTEGKLDGLMEGLAEGSAEGWPGGRGEGAHISPLTDTVKVHCLDFPSSSVAVRVTDVSPTGNKVPGCCVNVNVGSGSQSSSASAEKMTIVSLSSQLPVEADITVLSSHVAPLI